MKKIFLIFAIFLIPIVSGDDVIHNVELTNTAMTVESQIILISEENKDPIKIEWILSEDAELLILEDESGAIEDYTRDGDKLSFITNPDIDKKREDIRIVSLTRNPYSNEYSPFRRLDLSLPGYVDEESTVTISGDLLSSSIPAGFEVSILDNKVVMQGEGPAALIGYVGDSLKSKYYYYDGIPKSLDEAEDNYNLIPGTIGMIPHFVEFPILFLSDNSYDEQLTDFSAGTYKTGGIILVRSEEGMADTIIHETVHAYNDQIMNWRSVESAWFDEGTAQYVEWLYREKKGEVSPNLFGDDVTYREGITLYTLPSKGDREDLWDYYKNNKNFMNNWSPIESSKDRREFGYAFSELLIRKYIMDNGAEGLHTVYGELSKIEEDVDDYNEFNQIVLNTMGTNFKPCYSTNRNEFDSCIDEVNDFEPIILEFTGDVRTSKSNDNIRTTETFRDIETSKEEGYVNETVFDKIILFIQNVILKIQKALA